MNRLVAAGIAALGLAFVVLVAVGALSGIADYADRTGETYGPLVVGGGISLAVLLFALVLIHVSKGPRS